MLQQHPLAIVHVVRQFHPGVGGMENFVEQLAAHQLAAGHQVSVVTLDRLFGDPSLPKLKAREQHRGIEVRRVPYSGSRRYPIAPRVLGAIRDADLVHVHGVDFFCDYLSATAALHRKPLVLTTHGGFFHTSFASGLKKLYFRTVTRAALGRYGAVIACSEEDERRFRTICAPRLTLIPNPVDIDKFEGLADPQCSTLIYFGRLAPNKEVDALIAWFAGLASTSPEWRLIVAGKPMGTDIRDLRARVQSLGLNDRVEFHETPSDEQLRRLIARSAVYCCASSYEGFGLAAIEGASAGLYPVLSDIPPFRRSIDRLGYGSIVDFTNPVRWSESYTMLERSLASFRHDHDAQRVREAVAPFAWPRAISAFDDIYSRVLGRSSRRIGKVDVDVFGREAATDMILGAATAGQPLMITFCNAHTVNLASRDGALCNALQQATVLNDGIGVDLASRMIFGSSFPENLNGTDFVPHLMAATEQPLRAFLLGGEPGVAEAAAKKIKACYPKVEIAGTMHGFFDKEQSEEVVAAIRASGSNLLLVAMGQPSQELWAARHYREMPGPTLCVGALLDFLAERVPRAPVAVRKLRLEWAFRLLGEPRRLFRRYIIGNVAFLGRTIGQRLTGSRI